MFLTLLCCICSLDSLEGSMATIRHYSSRFQFKIKAMSIIYVLYCMLTQPLWTVLSSLDYSEYLVATFLREGGKTNKYWSNFLLIAQ